MPRIRFNKTAGLLLILAAAGFFLRIHSLSHDLDLGIVYHPDTPKQMVAATKYLQGDYFYRVGNLNYDGYPFFNSRLAAWCYRIIAGPVNLFARHIGLSEPLMQPTLQTFFWITRFLNCLLSTLSIPVAFFLTRRLFSEKAAWLAALMVLLSPLEIMASHTAMNDTGAAFFAFLCLWICVEIFFQKKLWLYGAFAAAFACGFFTKYHAALALIPLVLCHLIRFPRRRDWISKAFWIPVLLTTSTGILAAGIANPALALDPRGTIQLIIDFMDYTSDFGMSDEIRALSPLQRWGFGLTHNLPSFRSALTLPALLLAPLGLLIFFRKRPACWITASMALVYLGIALPFKPLAQPQYHTLVLPIFFVLSAGSLLHLFSLPRWRILSAPLAAVLSGLILWGLFQQTDEVLFYYRLSNSRLLAERWMDRNVPKTFRAAAGHYTLVRQPPHVENPDGRIMLSSSFRPHRAPENPDLVTTLDMQDEAFSSFRNPVITLYLHRTDWLTPPIRSSFLSWPAPAPASHNVMFAEAPDFLQTPAMIEGTGALNARRTLFSDQPVKKFYYWFRNGPRANELKIHAGSISKTLHLAPWEQVTGELLSGSPRLHTNGNRFVYELKIKSTQGGNFLWINGTEQAAQAAYLVGRNAWKLSGKFDYSLAAESMKSSGLTDDYLQALPFQEISAEDFIKRAPESLGWISRPVYLTPGVFEIQVPASISWTLLDAATGQSIPTRQTDGKTLFTLPPGANPVALRTESQPQSSTTFTFRPQLQASAEAFGNFRFNLPPPPVPQPSFPAVRYQRGIQLKNLQVQAQEGRLTLNPVWELRGSDVHSDDVAVWAHLKNAEGEILAQFDHPLSLDLGLNAQSLPLSSLFYDWGLPDGLPDEGLELHLGLYLPIQNQRLKVRGDRPDVRNDGFIYPLTLR